jgi:hypothetical protein
MHTFDRGFANAAYQWTVNQLLNHFRLIERSISIHAPAVYTPNLLLPSAFSDYFTPIANAFFTAKAHFIQIPRTAGAYSWAFNDNFQWTDEINMNQDQRKNIDLLTYWSKGVSWNMYIECVAIINTKNELNLFVGSIVDGVTTHLPIFSLPADPKNFTKAIETTAQDLINKIFEQELCILIEVFHRKNIN